MTDEIKNENPELIPEETQEQETESFSTDSIEPSESPEADATVTAPQIDSERAAENLAQIASAIKSLPSALPNYKAFFDHAKEISQFFKTLKPLPHVEREQLWQEFSTLCDDTRTQQNSEREEHKLVSLELRGKLEAQLVELAQAGPNAKFADEFSKISNQMKAIREEFSGTKEKPSPLIPKDREALWKLWKSTDDAIWSHRKAVREENYTFGKEHMTECAALATEGDPFDCHKKIKELRPWQRNAELAREQRDEIRKSLDLSWEAATARIEAGRADRKQQHEQWTERSSNLLEDWELKLEKMRDFKVKLEEQIARLNEMETGARTDEFADQVAGWRKEKEDKLADVDKNLALLVEKIDSVKKRLK